MASDQSKVSPVAARPYPPTLLCVSYGTGSAGASILLNIISVYFPVLMSTVLGVSPAIAGTLMMVSKLYDAFADIAIGTASDRTESRWGRRRPFLLWGGVVGFLSILMIFFAPPMGQTMLIAYMGLGLVIYSTGYSLFNVPFLAMPAEITRTSAERLRLVAFRTSAVGLAQVVAVALSAWIIQQGGGGASGYRLMGAVMATLALCAMLIAFFGTAGARMNESGAPTHKTNLRDVIGAFSNRPLMLLIGAKLCQYIAFGIMTPINLLFLLNVTHFGMTGMIHLAVVQNGMVFLAMPAWTRLGRWLGKRGAYLLAQAIMIPAIVSWWWVDGTTEIWGLWWRGGMLGFASAGALLMSTSMLPDTIEYDRLRVGRERGGIFASLYSVNEKLGFAIGALVLGWGLAAGGYAATTGGKIVTQSASAIQSLYLIKTIAPTSVLLIGVILLLRYRLDDSMLAALRTAPGKDD